MKKPLIILFCLIFATLTISCQMSEVSQPRESSIPEISSDEVISLPAKSSDENSSNPANSFYENGSFEYEWGKKVAEISDIYEYSMEAHWSPKMEYYFMEIQLSVNEESIDGFSDMSFVYIDSAESVENLVHVFFTDPSVTGERKKSIIFLGEKYALIGGEVIFDMESRKKYSIPFLETFDANNTEEIDEGTAKYLSNYIYDSDNNRLIYSFMCGYVDANNDFVMYDYLYTYDLKDITNPSEKNWKLVGKYLAEGYNTAPYLVDLKLNQDGTVTYREDYEKFYKVDMKTGERSPVVE